MAKAGESPGTEDVGRPGADDLESYTPEELSRLLKRSVKALAWDRETGRGIRYFKYGRLVRYPKAAVREFMARNARKGVHTPAEPTAGAA